MGGMSDPVWTSEELESIRLAWLLIGDPWENSLGHVCFNCNQWVSLCACGHCEPIDEDELDRLIATGSSIHGF